MTFADGRLSRNADDHWKIETRVQVRNRILEIDRDDQCSDSGAFTGGNAGFHGPQVINPNV